jgi:sugar phosphate isomerase/epimerase
MSLLPMLHSVSYSGSWGQAALSVEQFVDRAADLGFDGVMLMAKRPHLSVLDWDAKARAQLRKQLEHRKIERVCVAGYNNFTADLEHSEVPHGENLVAAAQKLAPLTVQTTVANYQRRPRYHYNPALVNYSEQMPYVQAVPIEEGFIDYAQFLTTLVAGGFQGAVAYEMCSPLLEGGSLEVLDRYARLFAEFLKRFNGDLNSRRMSVAPALEPVAAKKG